MSIKTEQAAFVRMPRHIGWRRFAAEFYAGLTRDDLFNSAAALAFYEMLAIFPAMIVLTALIPFLPVPHVDQAIMDLLRQAMPDGVAATFTGVVQHVTSERRGGLLSLGVVGALWASSTGMVAIMQQLNKVFEVAERRPFLLSRATALALTVMFGSLVLAAFSLVVFGGLLQDWLGGRFGFTPWLLGFFVVFRWIVIVAALLLALALVYRFAPYRHRAFALLTPGTVAATATVVAASIGFSVYASHFAHYSAVYGSVGTVVMLMVWLYLIGFVVLAGAKVDAVLKPPRAAEEPAGELSHP